MTKKYLLTWYLVDINDSKNNNKKYLLTTNENSRFIFIGKSNDCDIKLNLANESKSQIEDQHALLFYDNYDNKLQLKDLGSIYGTYVNDVKLIENNFVSLNKNDYIKFSTKFKFKIDCIESEFDQNNSKIIDDKKMSKELGSSSVFAISTTTMTVVQQHQNEFNNRNNASEYDDDKLSETGTYTIDTDNPTSPEQNKTTESDRTEAIDYTFGIKSSINLKDVDTLNNEEFVDTTLNTSTDSCHTPLNEMNGDNEDVDKQKKRQLKKYSNRMKKTLTYDVIKNPDAETQATNDDEDENNNETNKTFGQLSLCTDVLMGDTNELIKRINEKKSSNNGVHRKSEDMNYDIETLSTRAAVNGSVSLLRQCDLDDQHNQTPPSYSLNTETDDDDLTSRSLNETSLSRQMGGLAFNVDFNDLNQRLYELKRNRASTTSTTSYESNLESVKTKSLGTKIQEKAQKNADFGFDDDVNDRRLSQQSQSQSPSTQTNRALYLRQQSARSKRDALSNSPKSASSSLSSSLTATTSKKPVKTALKETQSVNSSSTCSSNSSSMRLTQNNKLKMSNSRSQSPAVHSSTHNLNSKVTNQLSLAAAKEAFQKRKNYNPLKSLNDEKIKKKLTPTSPPQVEFRKKLGSCNDYDMIGQDLNVSIQNLKTNINTTNQTTHSNGITRTTSMKTSKSTTQLCQDYHDASDIKSNRNGNNQLKRQPSEALLKKTPSTPLTRTLSLKQPTLSTVPTKTTMHQKTKQLSTTLEFNKNGLEPNTYENLLKSTVQRLCIRLIQMSTSVLDKIGDASTGNDDIVTLGSSELERMQNLAKLVHSMQLLNDHVQVIDTTLNSTNGLKQEDANYLDYV